MAIADLVQKTKFLVNENSPTILTGVSVVGTGMTALLTGRASFKAARLIDREAELLSQKKNGDVLTELEMTRWAKIKLVWPLYIPPVAACLTTMTSTIAANRVASSRLAAMVIASGISERALQEYKAKVVEKLGERQNTAIRDEIAQDRVSNNPPGEVVMIASGQVLCYDMLTGRYFNSTVENIKRAENKINFELNHFMNASLSEFYDEIGLPSTAYSDSVGWGRGNLCEVEFSTTMSPDDRPCVAINFKHPPVADYMRYEYD
jgi:hypothetical protein